MIDKDRVVAITGATGTLGTTAARSLVEQGARLALFGTNEERLQSLASDLGLPDDRVLTGVFNFTSPDAAKEAAGMAAEKFGRIDILLHLIGGWTGGKALADAQASDLSDMLNQHVWTTFYLAQAFLPGMVENRWGRIIIVSSPLASNPTAKMGPYTAAKAAQETLLLTAAKEAAGSGVTANILRVRTIDEKHERDRQPTSDNARWTTPEEITAAILYLCSNEAHVINGARIPLFGGS